MDLGPRSASGPFSHSGLAGGSLKPEKPLEHLLFPGSIPGSLVPSSPQPSCQNPPRAILTPSKTCPAPCEDFRAASCPSPPPHSLSCLHISSFSGTHFTHVPVLGCANGHCSAAFVLGFRVAQRTLWALEYPLTDGDPWCLLLADLPLY